MKQYFLQYTLLLCVASALYAKAMPMQTQEFPKKEMKKQNIQIASLAAQAMSKNLPKQIDKYTTLLSVKNDATTLVYTFAINSDAKSDAAIQKEDHKRMQKAVTEGVCQSSQRFLQAGIDTAYVYVSVKTKKPLFRFDITKDKCTNLITK